MIRIKIHAISFALAAILVVGQAVFSAPGNTDNSNYIGNMMNGNGNGMMSMMNEEGMGKMIDFMAFPEGQEMVKKELGGEQVGMAKHYGVQTIPAVAVNGELVTCCDKSGVDIKMLKAAGVGQ